MKLRLLVLVVATALLLAACSMAEDITPPPDYAAPTAAPVVEVVYPSVPPSLSTGAVIYWAECAACHGETGLGNGSMSDQMPVAVPAIGLREISSQATPADWYLLLIHGNVNRGMPAYPHLTDTERWDVLAYTYSLSTSAEQIQTGAALFAENCAECHGAAGNQNPAADFTDPAFIAQRSGTGMYRQVSEGGTSMPEFGSLLAEDEIFALTDYVRSLSFGEPLVVAIAEPTSTEEPVAVTLEPVAGATDVPVADAQATPEPELVLLSFNGSVRNASDTALETDLIFTLHQYDMATGIELDPVVGSVNADGIFQFADIAATFGSQMAYWVDVEYMGVPYQSDFVTYDGTMTAFDLPVVVYDSSSDYSLLTIPLVEEYFLFEEGTLQVFQLYQVVNDSNQTVIFPVEDNAIPFIQVPEGAVDVQFSPGGTTSPFITARDGVGMYPGADLIYEIVAVFTMPYEKRLSLDIPFGLPAAQVDFFVEDGIKVKSKMLDEVGPTAIQEINFVQYEAVDVPAESVISITISGSVSTSPGSTPVLDQRLIIGIGIAGLLLIAAGVFLFIRERKRSQEEDEFLDDDEEGEDALGDDPEEIMDAIIALDDQYKAGGISKEAYEQRREELKARLKE